MSDFIIRFRWPIVIGFLIISIGFGFFIPQAETDPDLENYIPDHIDSKVNTDTLEEYFGGSDMIMLLFEADDILERETLLRIKKVSKELKRVDGVERVLSLFDTKSIKGEDGMMLVDPAVKRIPRNEEQKEKLRADLKSNNLAYGMVISKDFKLASVIATLSPDITDIEIINQVDSILLDFPGAEIIHKGGQPYLRESIKNDVNKDAQVLIPSALALMLIILLISFKKLRGVLLPLSVVTLSVSFSMGLIPIFGWKFSIITLLLPIMLIAIANNYGIHLVARYEEMNTPGNRLTTKTLAKRVFDALKNPIILTGLTTIGGILCLLSHTLIPARQLGVLAGIGISYALILSLFFIPALMAILPKTNPKPKFQKNKHSWLDKSLFVMADKIARFPKRVIVIFSIVIAISGVGFLFIEVDSNMENFFPSNHPFKVSSELINDNFGGSQNISVLVSGDMKDPQILKQLAYYEDTLENIDGVGDVMSLATVIREMGKALNDEGDSLWGEIPSSRNAVAQYLVLYNMSGDPDDFEQIVDFDYENAQLMIRVSDASTKSINHISETFDELSKDDEHVSIKGGFALINQGLSDAIINGQVSSLILAVIIVAILLMIIFRSFGAGVIGSVPLAAAIIFMFGLMGYLDLKIDIASALLSSIMIGVGIDYTIHFLWRFKQEREAGLTHEKSVVKTLISTGKGITFNAISVMIGFTVTFISGFLPIKFFGFLIVVSILTCLLGALILMPAIVLVWKPKFLESKQTNK